MRRLLYIFIVLMLCFSLLVLSTRGRDAGLVVGFAIMYITHIPELVKESNERKNQDKKDAAEKEQMKELLRQAELDPSVREENMRKIAAKALAKYKCKGYEEFCYALIVPSEPINLKELVHKFEREKRYTDYTERSFILGLMATSENIDIHEAAEFGMSPVNPESKSAYRERIVRAALLRRALAGQPAHPKSVAMADRLLELDGAIFDRNSGRSSDFYQMYLGMDNELRAIVGPENEFRLWADKARGHYLQAISEGHIHRAIIALIHSDALAASETQRLEAVRLFIKNVPNQIPDPPNTGASPQLPSKNNPVPDSNVIASGSYGMYYMVRKGDPNIPFLSRLNVIDLRSEDIQPSIWGWIMLHWRPDWGTQLDEILQQNGANQEISTLLSQAYPPFDGL